MADESDSVVIRVSTENLNRAIQLLRQLGHARRWDAYQVLVLERYRRRLQAPPIEIRLDREAFEALPHAVRQLFVAESS
jgi:hypothetical protein